MQLRSFRSGKIRQTNSSQSRGFVRHIGGTSLMTRSTIRTSSYPWPAMLVKTCVLASPAGHSRAAERDTGDETTMPSTTTGCAKSCMPRSGRQLHKYNILVSRELRIRCASKCSDVDTPRMDIHALGSLARESKGLWLRCHAHVTEETCLGRHFAASGSVSRLQTRWLRKASDRHCLMRFPDHRPDESRGGAGIIRRNRRP